MWRATLEDGRDVVVKTAPSDARLEAEGLEALRAAGAPTPVVIAVDRRVLVLEYVRGGGDPHSFGRRLAGLHGALGEWFGWHADNVLGPLRQDNTPSSSWPAFFVTRRIEPHLDALPDHLAARVRTAVADGRAAALLDHDPAPSLVHGDLWSGNVLGWQWVVDPAVHYADREVDLAMLALFGDLPETFLRGYTEVAPLPAGVDRRRPLLQLAPLLVHVRLFGGVYHAGVERRLETLGW